MMSEPKLEKRSEQPYLGIRTQVQMKDIGAVLPALHNKLADWMERQSIQPTGPLFFRYLIIDAEKGCEMEVGVPVEKLLQGEGEIRAGVLPAGNYATVIHTGHFSGLFQATHALLEWGEKNHIAWMKAEASDAEAWEARLEIYLNVGLEKDPTKWQTQLAFLTAED